MPQDRRSRESWRTKRAHFLASIPPSFGVWKLENQTTAVGTGGRRVKVLASREARSGRWWHGFRKDEWGELRPVGLLVLNERSDGRLFHVGLDAAWVAELIPRLSQKRGSSELKFESCETPSQLRLTLADGSWELVGGNLGSFAPLLAETPPRPTGIARVLPAHPISTVAEPDAEPYVAGATAHDAPPPALSPSFLADYSGGVLRPRVPLAATEHTVFRVHIEAVSPLLEAFDWVLGSGALAGLPSDLADAHDLYRREIPK